jgi:hypothetical protein
MRGRMTVSQRPGQRIPRRRSVRERLEQHDERPQTEPTDRVSVAGGSRSLIAASGAKAAAVRLWHR